MDQLVAGLANGFRSSFHKPVAPSMTGWFSWWVQAGCPGPAVTPPSGAGEAPTEATAGALAYVNATSPARNYLAATEVFGQSGIGATLYLYDRLVHTSGLSFTTTASQTINSAAITRPDALGAGTELFLEVYGGLFAAASSTVVTVSYTNAAGVSGRNGTSLPIPSSPTFSTGALFPISLASGDTGVRSVQAVSLTPAGALGSFGITIGRRLAQLGMTAMNGSSYSGVASDAFALGLPALDSHACLWPVSFGLNPGPPIGALISVAAG